MNSSASPEGERVMELRVDNGNDEFYRHLFVAATKALETEDKVLHDAIKNGHNVTGGYEGVARGLTYWLFETTLVYVIFRAWVNENHVAWEHALAATRNPLNTSDAERTAKATCDLMLFVNGKAVAAFEAKWWNYSNANRSLEQDVRKLKSFCPNLEKYLLTFWWGTDKTMGNDLTGAESFCKNNKLGLELRFVGTFTTILHDQSPGYFAFCAIRVA